MRITIDYNSCWRNSFYSGTNDEPTSKTNPRNYIASMSSLKKEGNYKLCPITNNTVMGVMNRLIGDKRKLYQSRNDDDYYFNDVESLVEFEDVPAKQVSTEETVFLRNMTGSTDRDVFLGAVDRGHPALTSDYSDELWGVLSMEFEDLCVFICTGGDVESRIEPDPLVIAAKLEAMGKMKPVEDKGFANQARERLEAKFEGCEYLTKKGLIMPHMFYCAALYVQLEALSKRYDTSTAVTPKGCIKGVSKRGFTKRDFMKSFTSRGAKLVYGNPYVKKQKVKGQGEVTSKLIKANGQLKITLDVGRERAKEIKAMIENAGVSSFRLGKKGLASVTKIKL